MIEKVLDIEKIPYTYYYKLISRQEGSLEDCQELKNYYENLEQQIKELQEEKQKWLESSEGFRKELVEEHKVALSLASERDTLKNIIVPFMEKCRANDFDLRQSKYHIAQLFYDLDKALGVKN